MSLETTEASPTLAGEATRYLTGAAFRRDPWRFFAQVRAQSPVIQSDAGVWLITGYDAASEALRNDEVLSRRVADSNTWSSMIPKPDSSSPRRCSTTTDPNTPGCGVWSLMPSPAVASRTGATHHRNRPPGALDAVMPAGRMDLVTDYAYPVVEQIITELLGIRHGDLPQFLAWSEAITEPPPGAT